MLTYCLKCKKDAESIDSKMWKTNNGKTMLSLIWAAFKSRKSRFVKEQVAKESLCSLEIKAPLNKIPLLGDNLF